MRLFEVVDQRTHVHLVMELCHGQSLFHHTKKLHEQRMPVAECKEVFRQLMLGVGYMHSRGIAHRDLKLDNILLNADTKKIKIIDFGFASESAPQALTRNFCGTPHYMDPDIVRKTPYNPFASDIWACGVILYILYTGKLPFFAEFEADLYRKIQSGKFAPVPQDLPEPMIKNLFTQIFTTDSKRRPTADDVLRSAWVQAD